MKIDFYIPKDTAIPLQLRLKVNEQYDVYYEKIAGTFGYKFTFYKINDITKEMAIAITDEIVLRMIDQSYDHDSSWRERDIREIFESDFKIIVNVYFRVRDAG